MLTAFETPQRMKVYEDGTLRIVSNSGVLIGTEVPTLKNKDGKWIYKPVLEILEERKSRGFFINEKDRPYSYRVRVA